MIRKILVVSMALSLAGPAPQAAFAWGKIGHRVTGDIAERYLSEEARGRPQIRFTT